MNKTPLQQCQFRSPCGESTERYECSFPGTETFSQDGCVPESHCRSCKVHTNLTLPQDQSPPPQPDATGTKKKQLFPHGTFCKFRSKDRVGCGCSQCRCDHPAIAKVVEYSQCLHCEKFECEEKRKDQVYSFFSPKTDPFHIRRWVDSHADLHGPEGWWYFPNFQQAFRSMLNEKLDELQHRSPPAPSSPAGRAVVILGGGPRYEIGVYVAVRFHRYCGYTGPIQIWHRGDDEKLHQALFAPYDCEIVNAYQIRDKHPCRRWGMDKWGDPNNQWLSWGMKSYAAQHSRYDTIFYHDADWYPVASVDDAFANNPTGSVVWGDISSSDEKPNWAALGIEPQPWYGFQGGQWLVDKARCWKALELYRWFDEYSDYYYRHGYGDQFVMRLAWAAAYRAGMIAAPHTYNARCWLRRGALVAHLPGMKFLGVHRVNDKQFERKNNILPYEGLAHQFAAEYRAGVANLS